MDIDREALVLYLRDLRDLEIAKRKINTLYRQEKGYIEKQIASLKASHFEIEVEWDPMGLIVTPLIFGAPIIFLKWLLGRMGTDFISRMIGFILKGFMVIGIIGLVVLVAIGIGEGIVLCSKRRKARKHNREEEIRLQNNSSEIRRLEAEWQKRSAYWGNEYKKVESLLQEYYNQNILAKQYRELSALIYIYDYMSTSQESFRDVLFHEHMEDGIRKILNRLDQIIRQNENIIFSQHRLESQNDRMVSQNQQMLGRLERTEANTFTAAQYARISANYDRATSYFAEALYLENKR